MITFEVYEARTYYEGPPPELDSMYHRLRIKTPNAVHRARELLESYGPKGMGKFAPHRISALIERDMTAGQFDTMLRKILKAAIEENKIDDDDIERIVDLCDSARYTKFYDGRSDSFGTGLLGRVKTYLRRKGIPFQVQDRRPPRPDLLTNGEAVFHFKDKFENRDEQYGVIKAACEKGSGILHCATNFGKTDVAAAISEVWREKLGSMPSVLFLIHRQGLVIQTKKRFEGHLQVNVGIAGAGQFKVCPIMICTTQTASNLVQENDMEFRDYLGGVNIVFLDEVHTNKAKMAQRVMNHCKARLRFALSGTVSRKKSKLLPLMAMTGPIIAEVRNKELVALGRSAKPYVRMIEVHTKKRIEGYEFRETYTKGIVKCTYRNDLVTDEVANYVQKNFRTMVTVYRVSHGFSLLNRFEDEGLSVQFIRGQTPLTVRERAKADFVNRKFHVLIVSSIFDVGEDLPDIDAWVNAAAGKGWELTLQRMGRVLRRKEGLNRVYFSDFLDLHAQYLDEHSQLRLEYYEKEEVCDIQIVIPTTKETK